MSIRTLFAKPAVGVVGSISSIVAVPLAVYLFVTGHTSRELIYYVHPAKAAVVRIGQTSRLTILLDGSRIDRNVSAAQIAIWNEGKQSIRPENMLSPLVIRTGEQNPILEAEIRKSSRDVVGLDRDIARIESGEVQIDWKILERHDGGILQIIFFGDADTEITASATIEGQGDIRRVEDGAVTVGEKSDERLARVVATVVSIVAALLIVFMFRNTRRELGSVPVSLFVTFSAGFLFFVGGTFFFIFQLSTTPSLPFDFF